MKLVVIESPYGSPDPKVVEENEAYVRRCMAHALREGCAPYASHALYTQPGVLDDRDEAERALGMSAGFAWGAYAEEVWVFVDRGVSSGMVDGVSRAIGNGRAIDIVRLDGEGGPKQHRWTGDLVELLSLFALPKASEG